MFDRTQRFAFRSTIGAILLAALVTIASSAIGVAHASAAAGTCIPPTKLAVTFVIDDSGSMSTSDPEVLRASAVRIALQQLPDGSIASAGSFDDYSRSFFDPTQVNGSNRDSLADIVENGLYASGGTDYGEAASLADTQIDKTVGADKQAIIFLSDGEPTANDDAFQYMKHTEVPVYTVGFNTVEASTLEEIAYRSGGSAFYASSVSETQTAFAKIISDLNCDANSVSQVFSLAPGQSRSFPFNVEFADQFRALTTWDFGDLSVRIRRPNGSYLADGSTLPDEAFTSGYSYALATAGQPAAGGWSLEATASADNVDDITVSLDIFNRPRPKDLPIVLISGMGSTSGQATPDASGRTNCGGAGDMLQLCAYLVSKGFPVYVAGVKPGPGATINSWQGLTSNAGSFAKFMKGTVGANFHGGLKPVLIGHSFGGMVARRAVSDLGVQASAIVTIGTPHDGSFWADALEATVAACWLPNPIAFGPCAAAKYEWNSHPITHDLTYSSRHADVMGSPNLPVFTYAGMATGNDRFSKRLGEYVAPSDGVVGLSSARGKDANLGKKLHALLGGSAWHSRLGLFGFSVNAGSEIELESGQVDDQIKNALFDLLNGKYGVLPRFTRLSPSVARSGHPRHRALVELTAAKAKPAPRISKIKLSFVARPKRIKAGTKRVKNGMVVSRSPFTLQCGSNAVPSFAVTTGANSATASGSCVLAVFDYAGAFLIPARSKHAPAGEAVYDRKHHSVTITVHGARGASVQIGKHKVIHLHRHGGKVRATLGTRAFQGKSAFVVAKTRASFAAPLPSGG